MTSPADPLAETSLESGRLGFDRVVFFSDAVFAIAMTLLVVDLRLPELVSDAEPDIVDALWGMRWDVFAYILSFLVIGSFWLAHWRRYHHIERVDGRHAAINILFLAAIAFIPFPTSVLGTAGDPPVTVAFYAVCVSLAGFLGLATVVDAWWRHLYAPSVTWQDVRSWLISGSVVPVVMIGSLLLLPFIGSLLTEWAWVGAALLGGLLVRRRA